MKGLIETLGVLLVLAIAALWLSLLFFAPAALVKFLWLYLVG